MRRAGRDIHLKPKAFQILLYLVANRDRLISREELLQQFWKDTVVGEDVLAHSIAEVRRALGDSPREPLYLKTVPKRGYRFVGEVEEIGAEPVVAREQITTIQLREEYSDDAPERRQWRWPASALVLLIGLLTAGVLAWRWFAGARPDGGAERRVVAILPFDNRSGQSNLEWLREGLPDMLATTFLRSRSLDVVSREQAYTRRKAENKELRTDIELARAAHAQAVVIGSFSNIGSSIRVDARMYDTARGTLLASDDIVVGGVDRILTEIDTLATRLGGRLGPRSRDHDGRVLTSLMTDNLEAYRYYSLGLDKAEAAQTREALELFQKALALDPGFVMAQARIGYAYAVANGFVEKGRPYLEKAFRMSAKLTDRDRRHIYAWYAIANQDYQRAIRRYTELLNEYPNDLEAYNRIAVLLRGESRHEEALRYLHREAAMNPEDPQVYNRLSEVYSEMGRHDEAIAAAQRYIAVAPDDANAYDSLGLAYYMAGQYDRALQAYSRALAVNPDFGIVPLHRALAYWALGRVNDAVHESMVESGHGSEHLTGCRGLGQATYILWRSGKLADARTLAARRTSDCDPRLFDLVLGARVEPQPAVISITGFMGRGSRFGQRTRFFYASEYAKAQVRREERLAHLRQLLGVRPAWAEMEIWEDTLGDAYLELGRVDEAIHEYERALKLFPRLARARYHLGQALVRKGQREAAKMQFQEFLRLWNGADRDLPEVVEAQRYLQ